MPSPLEKELGIQMWVQTGKNYTDGVAQNNERKVGNLTICPFQGPDSAKFQSVTKWLWPVSCLRGARLGLSRGTYTSAWSQGYHGWEGLLVSILSIGLS